MCKSVSVEQLLGSILSFSMIGVSFSELQDIESSIYKYNREYIIDVSRSAVFSVVFSWDDYFQIKNDRVFLTEYYQNNIDRIRYRFFNSLDKSFQDVLVRSICDTSLGG